ncbi:MAG: response regulator [Dehalococcoidia bacterium]|nr:response regulator [Dehalococcoidia bacterium]
MTRAKVLLIDDDPDFIESTRMVLQSKYDVITASGGEEGLKKARIERPNVILLDIIMPLTDGFTIAESIKKDPQLAKTPILMLTSFSERVGESTIPVSRGYTLEAEDYISKPVKPDELLRRVGKWA